MASAVNKDTFYTVTANELRYRIMIEDKVIFEGMAYSRPGSDEIKVNVSRICRDWLENELPVIDSENATYTHEDAVRTFTLASYNNGVWSSVATYDFLWYYDDTNSIPSTLSLPVNGRSAIGVRNLKTTYNGSSVVTSIITSDVEVGCQKEDYSREYLTFEILSDGYISLYASKNDNRKYISYRKNGYTWWGTYFSGTPNTIQVSRGDIVEFRGVNDAYAASNWFNGFSGTTCQFKLRGNIMSLIDLMPEFIDINTLESAYTFSNLFRGCTGLTDASKLVLPATTLSERCYQRLFRECTSLKKVELPRNLTALNGSVFQNCSSLVEIVVPEGVTKIDSGLFYSCNSLTDIYCYSEMPPEIDGSLYGVPLEQVTVHVPVVKKYKKDISWKAFSKLVPIQ